MSQDFNNMKYSELYEHAKELGLSVKAGMKKVDLIDAIKVGTAAPETISGELLKKSDRVRLTIHESSDKNAVDPVFVGVQGIGYTIKRGVPVDVPRSVVTALENARQDIMQPVFDEKGGMSLKIHSALSYPYSVSE